MRHAAHRLDVITTTDENKMAALLLLLLTTQTTAAHIPCSSCLQLSKSLEHAMLQQERQRAHTPPEQQARLGRSVPFRSEHDVDAVLDTWCHEASAHGGVRLEALHRACTSILTAHREAVSNHLLDQGSRSVRSILCVDLTHACQAHELYDSGEL